MHPGAHILLAVLSALALPGLSFLYLVILSLLLSLVVLKQPMRVWRLLQRSRWLLLGMTLVYAYQVPGEPLLAEYSWSPSQAGLTAGLMQSWRLLLLLILIDKLVLQLPLEYLLAGIASLLWPLRSLRIPVERIVTRLGLTLHALGSHTNRKGLLPDIEAMRLDHLPEQLALRLPAWRWRDGLLLVSAAMGWLWLAA